MCREASWEVTREEIRRSENEAWWFPDSCFLCIFYFGFGAPWTGYVHEWGAIIVEKEDEGRIQVRPIEKRESVVVATLEALPLLTGWRRLGCRRSWLGVRWSEYESLMCFASRSC